MPALLRSPRTVVVAPWKPPWKFSCSFSGLLLVCFNPPETPDPPFDPEATDAFGALDALIDAPFEDEEAAEPEVARREYGSSKPFSKPAP